MSSIQEDQGNLTKRLKMLASFDPVELEEVAEKNSVRGVDEIRHRFYALEG